MQVQTLLHEHEPGLVTLLTQLQVGGLAAGLTNPVPGTQLQVHTAPAGTGAPQGRA